MPVTGCKHVHCIYTSCERETEIEDRFLFKLKCFSFNSEK